MILISDLMPVSAVEQVALHIAYSLYYIIYARHPVRPSVCLSAHCLVVTINYNMSGTV